MSKMTPTVPENLAHKPLETWSPADISAFLKANQEQYYFLDESIDTLYNARVPGTLFISFTEEHLSTRYNLPLGTAEIIVILIKALLPKSQQATMSKITPTVPKNLAHKPLETWSPADISAFLKANQERYYFLDESIDTLYNARVPGSLFISFTQERLSTRYKMPLGTAEIIDLLIKALLPKSQQASQQVPPQASQQVPPQASQQVPPQQPYSYRVNSGLIPYSDSQKKDIYYDDYILRELKGNVQQNVKGFDRIFDPQLDQRDIPNPSEHTFSEWFKLTEGAYERYGVKFMEEFSDSDAAKTSGRCYRGSGSQALKDSYQRTNKKIDIFLMPRIDLSNENSGYSWKSILVVGEFKSVDNQGLDKHTVIQLAGYVRETFGAQPGRRFVYAFTVCGKYARLWLFDRAGVTASEPLDLLTEEGSKSFRRALLGFMCMSESELGIGESKSGSLTICGKSFQLNTLLFYSPSIISRGTICWSASCQDTGDNCVIKECWRDSSQTPEFEFWEHAKKNKVLGCLDILASCELESACIGSDVANNIRRNLDFRSATKPPFKKWMIDSTSTAFPTISDLSDTSNFGTCTGTTSRKRKDQQTETSSSKKLKTTSAGVGVECRVRTLTVMRNLGVRLETISCPRVLLEVIRDAVKCHRSLYEDGGILHCDISVNNILMNKTNNSDLKGFLIDLDNARYQIAPKKDTDTLTEDPSLSTTDTKAVSGTPPFMALELLFQRPIVQTWRHDLESFFYVLIWLCMRNPHENLALWREALTVKVAASKKRDDMISGFDFEILRNFKPEFKKLIPVVTMLRKVLFYWYHERIFDCTTPPGDIAKTEMYDKVIQTFDDGIGGI